MNVTTPRGFNFFSAEDQEAMRRDDSQAWRAIAGILFAIVTGGALLGIAGVLLSL